MAIRICVFDAYGTLFDVAAAAREAAEEPGAEALQESWPELAVHWRQKQLEYSWQRSLSGDFVDFWQLTQDGLDWAMEKMKLEHSGLRDRLLALYQELSAYPEAKDCLASLRADGRKTAILSNGSTDMLAAAVNSAGISDLLDDVLSVDAIRVFKPSPQVYDMVGVRYGTQKSEVLFVSSNGWDAAAAAGYGFTSVWVNRFGLPMERLNAQPDHVITDLSEIPALADTLSWKIA